MPRARKPPGRAALAQAPSQSTTLPVVVPTGLPYGAAGQQAASQRSIPLPAMPPPAPTGAPAPAASPPPGPAGGGGQFDMPGAIQAAQRMPPGSGPGLTGPSGRPFEPVTAGQWSGPGGGPEARAPMPGGPGQGTSGQTLQTLLASMASQPGASPDVAFLANYVNGGRV